MPAAGPLRGGSFLAAARDEAAPSAPTAPAPVRRPTRKVRRPTAGFFWLIGSSLADTKERRARAGLVRMLVKLRLDPVANLEVLEGSSHRAHRGGLVDLDVRVHGKRHADLAAVLERNKGLAPNGIELANLTDHEFLPPLGGFATSA